MYGQQMKIIVGHQQLMPYLTLQNAGEFIEFARKIFNAQEMLRTLNTKNEIQHSEIKIGESTIMLAEVGDFNNTTPGAMYVYVKDTDKTYFDAIDAGAISLMEPIDEGHGLRSAGFLDPFGNTWWIATLG